MLALVIMLVATMPVKMDAKERKAWEHQLLAVRKYESEWLEKAPDSYLATIQRVDFGERTTLSVGSAKESDVRLDEPGIAPEHVRITVKGDLFEVDSTDPKNEFTYKGIPRDHVRIFPSPIGVGRFTLRLSHQNFPAVLVQDPESPHFKEFKGRKYFAPDPAYRFELPLTPAERPIESIVQSTRGNQRKALMVGYFDFTIDGTACRLEAYRLLEPGVGENDLMVLFRDATTGKESYPVGRYVEPRKLPNGKFRLDFNEAYNPVCAYSEHYNCPIPPRGNSLKVAIRAGEMDAHYH